MHQPRWMKKRSHSLLGKYHEALVLVKKIREDEKRLHKHQKHVYHKYSEDVINKLNEHKEHQIAKNPEKTKKLGDEYDEKLRDYAKTFVNDFELMMALFNDVFEKLDKMVEFDDKSESDDLLRLSQLLHESDQYKGEFIFTEKSIEHFKKAEHHFEKQLAHNIKRDYHNAKREVSGEEPKHIGYLYVHKNDGKLAKDLRKTTKKFSENDQVLKDIADRVEEQLKHGVKPDFITIFEGYIREFAVVEDIIRVIRKDITELIVHHIHEHNKTAKVTYMFSAAIQEAIKEIHIPDKVIKSIEEFENGKEGEDPVGKKATEFANIEKQAEGVLWKELKRDHHYFKTFIHRIDSDKKDVHHEFEQSTRT